MTKRRKLQGRALGRKKLYTNLCIKRYENAKSAKSATGKSHARSREIEANQKKKTSRKRIPGVVKGYVI